MPKYSESISLSNPETDTVLAAAYQTCKTIGWDVLFAGEHKIIAQTPKNWKTKGQQVSLSVENDELIVESEMIYGESFDSFGRNKKNTQTFVEAYHNILNNISKENIDANIVAINNIREETIVHAAREEKEAADVDRAMNLSGSNLYATYTIMAANIIVFVLMALNGAGLMDLNSAVHIRWGSNLSSLTLSGDWWRLFTNVFIHFGVIHLVMNMYALYMIGIYLEPMLGKVKYVVSYICAGILASIASLWWHKEGVNSAGASGAIFGMYGLFLALLTTDLIPKSVRQALLKSIGVFVLYNLVYGMKGGIDNAAHIGGLISGFVIGYIYVLMIRSEKKEKPVHWIVPLIFFITAGIAFSYISNHRVSIAERNKVVEETKSSAYADNDKFIDAYNKFYQYQVDALAVMEDTTLDNGSMIQKLQTVSIPLWDKAAVAAVEMKNMNVSPAYRKKATDVARYISLRKEEIAVAVDYLNSKPDAALKLEEVRKQIEEVLQALK